MSPDSIAQEKARLQLINLRDTRKTIVDEIVLREGTTRRKLNELAQVIEQIMELDPELKDFAISDISSIIAKDLREKGCEALAGHVRHYLPPKYKNENLVRIDQTLDKINEIGGELGRHLPEECSSYQLQELYDKYTEFKNVYDHAVSNINKTQEKIEFIALQKGFQLNGERFRRQISHTDFDEDKPHEVEEWASQIRDEFYDMSDTWRSLGNKYYADPPRQVEELKEDYSNLKTFKIVLQPWDDFKSTGDILHAFERQYISDLHGKHAAGNSDKFPTKLCVECSDIDEKNPDPDDYEIMVYDTTSKTYYRCMKCGGTDSIQRGMSREQVGDSQAVTMRKAQNIIKHMPLLGQTLHRWSQKYIQPKEDSRKEAISRFFSESAIAGKGYKVAREITDK